jgi:hypothetical protein
MIYDIFLYNHILKYIIYYLSCLSYRLEHAIKIYILEDINLKNEHTMIKRLICAIDIHRQAMQLVFVCNNAYAT